MGARIQAAAVALLLLLQAAEAGEAIKPIASTAPESNHVYCTKPCLLRSLYVTAGASAGFLMTVDAAVPLGLEPKVIACLAKGCEPVPPALNNSHPVSGLLHAADEDRPHFPQSRFGEERVDFTLAD